MNVATTADVIRDMAGALEQAALQLRTQADRLEKSGDFEVTVDAAQTIQNLLGNLRLDLLLARPLNALGKELESCAKRTDALAEANTPKDSPAGAPEANEDWITEYLREYRRTTGKTARIDSLTPGWYALVTGDERGPLQKSRHRRKEIEAMTQSLKTRLDFCE